MKQCFTRSRRANRFHQTSHYGFSRKRYIKRGNDVHKKTFGCQTRLQAITLKTGKTKFIFHEAGC